MAPKSSHRRDPDIHKVERLQIPYSTNAPAFGSDVVAETLSALDIPYIALNPGASYRGLHDSIVNFLGNEQPQMLLCLHEEAAVAIAHGYAKVTGKAMAAAVHSNVGLFHATMAIFNAWCDRMPILILGATGPVDAMKRRPWIDWIHTAADQGAHHPQLHQVGRPAGLGRRRPRVGAARLLDVEHRAVRPDLHQPRRRGAGGQAAGAAAADRRQALHAAGGAGPVGRSGQEGGRHAARTPRSR